MQSCEEWAAMRRTKMLEKCGSDDQECIDKVENKYEKLLRQCMTCQEKADARKEDGMSECEEDPDCEA